ncbi:MAG: lipoprotein insertase outer membrane protein LolB [Rubrivivax sp.]
MRWRGRGAAAGLAVALSLLSGCATPPPEAALPWTSGRLALRVEASAERPAHGLNADFELRGDGRRGELRLSGALGGRLATTRWNADEAVLDTGQGERRYADLESLSRDALGEALPLRALPDWLAGRPWSGAASQAQADGFVQLGWAISLAGFAEGRIDAVREAPPPRVSVRVRLERPAS